MKKRTGVHLSYAAKLSKVWGPPLGASTDGLNSVAHYRIHRDAAKVSLQNSQVVRGVRSDSFDEEKIVSTNVPSNAPVHPQPQADEHVYSAQGKSQNSEAGPGSW